MTNAQYYTSHDMEGGAQEDEDMESKKRAMSALMEMLQSKDQSNYDQDDDGGIEASDKAQPGEHSDIGLLGNEAEGSPMHPSVNGGRESVLMKDAEEKKKLKSMSKSGR